MKKQKIKVVTTCEDLTTGEKTKTTKTKIQTIKSWDELTTEEKEAEIERNSEGIYSAYQDELYYEYQADIDYIREKYKNITFKEIYFDYCSQGSWIDSIKDFKYNAEPIEIFGEYIELYDIDIHIRKYIEPIDADAVEIYTYNIPVEKEERIKATKKYQKWVNSIVADVNQWIEEVNAAAKIVIDGECHCPYNLNDSEDASFFDFYFENEEYIFEEEI